ncbi:hypothetical protein HNP84_006961 [Thermocatellispora tengchongensis]|uniref:Uncharacterized protein n=1 Tax=Thermocatellispora tengchongensis TaxID=1073253 RepID=A0A840PDZ5_9ACTN|nr:hypothetical protein [Thermocatellispora tengchongensis]
MTVTAPGSVTYGAPHPGGRNLLRPRGRRGGSTIVWRTWIGPDNLPRRLHTVATFAYLPEEDWALRARRRR